MGGGSQDLLTSIDEDQRRPLFAGLFLPIRVPGSTRVFAGHVHEKGGGRTPPTLWKGGRGGAVTCPRIFRRKVKPTPLAA